MMKLPNAKSLISLSQYYSRRSSPKHLLLLIDIFYPMGEPILLQSLRCSPLAVVHYSFVGHCLAFAATSTRE